MASRRALLIRQLADTALTYERLYSVREGRTHLISAEMRRSFAIIRRVFCYVELGLSSRRQPPLELEDRLVVRCALIAHKVVRPV